MRIGWTFEDMPTPSRWACHPKMVNGVEWHPRFAMGLNAARQKSRVAKNQHEKVVLRDFASRAVPAVT
jgi:hypothetical protein